MALSAASLESIFPIVRQAQTFVTPRNVVGPRLLVRNVSALRHLSSKNFCNSFKHYGGHKNAPSLLTANVSANKSSVLNNNNQSTANGFLQQMRSICGRENCADPCDFPPCSPENIAKTECMQKRIERKKTKHQKTIYELYWERPECCANECIDAYPRFDDMYYRESDKERRIYTQTWNECPDMIILPKPVCCPDKIRYPPLCKRPPKDKPKTACHIDDDCPPDMTSPCPKIRMPCCRPARTEKCLKENKPKDCKKFNAPSPSFSECRKPNFRAPKITECWCLAAPSMCQVWAEWRRLQTMKRVR